MATPVLATAQRNYVTSAAIAERALREAQRAQAAGTTAVAATVVAHQAANAQTSQAAVAAILAEQGISTAAEAALNTLAFTSAVDDIVAMLEQIEVDFQFAQLISTLVQDAGRVAESVAVAVRPGTGWVRHLNPPSCSRCVVLAGRVYRYSQGFLRHPGCDCTMTPVSEGDLTYAPDPLELLLAGQVTGLSKADQRALLDGADFGAVVNVRRLAAGLTEAGEVLSRGRSRLTPAGIYRLASDQDEAIELLIRFGYIR